MQKILKKESYSENDYISNVRVTILDNGEKASISWNWPLNDYYVYCFVFDVPQGYLKEHSIEEMVETFQGRADIVDRRTPHNHIVVLEREGKQSVLLPAVYNRDIREYEFVCQEENNVSEIMKLRPLIRIRLAYTDISRGLFGLGSVHEQRVSMSMSGVDPLPGSQLFYRCVGRGRDHVKFGIDLVEFWKKRMEITVLKGEKVVFEKSDDSPFQIEVIQ